VKCAPRQPRHDNPRFLFVLVAMFLLLPATSHGQEAQEPAGTDAAGEATPEPASAGAASTPVESRLDEIDHRLRRAVHEAESADRAAAERAKTVITAGEAGFGITSPDRQFQARIQGQFQVDGRRFFGDQSLRDKDTFLVRRVRPSLRVAVAGLADAVLTPEFAGATTQLLDAYIDVHPWPWLRLRAGKFKAPVGLERLQSITSLVFTERALDQNLSSQRDVGAQLWGDVAGGVVRYEAAIFNGAPNGSLSEVDNRYSKTLAGRVFVQPFARPSLTWLGRLGVGFAVETGSEKGSSTIANGAVSGTWLGSFKSTGQNTIFSYLVSTTDETQTVIALHRHTRLNPQLYYYYGPFGLEAEYLRESQGVDQDGVESTVNNSAGHATVAYVLGGERAFEGPRVRNPFSLATGALGALEIGARYTWLTVDKGAFPALADPTKSVAKAKGFGIVLSWYMTRNVRLAASYDQTSFDGGAKNGSATANRNTEKILISRVQVGY
jgi:phosphate-selective porin OprO/OprP